MIKRRFIVLFSLLAVFTVYLMFCVAALMIKGAPPLSPKQTAARPDRGSIFDRNGRVLAIQIRFADIGVWKPDIDDLDLLCNELSGILGMSSNDLRATIEAANKDHVPLKKRVDNAEARQISALFEEKKIKGIKIDPIVGRVYPERNLASQVIGFVGDKNEGIELAFNKELDGVDDENKGSSVILTIDTYVQHVLEEISRRAMEENGAEAVMFVAMNPRTGDILGSASIPDFDPNNFPVSSAVSRMNRPAIWAFEPGSTFKVFSIAALLDSGAISENSLFLCNGGYTLISGSPITCLANHSRVTPREIIINSCNVGAAFASDNISNSAFYNKLCDFGFGSRTGAGIRGESAGIFAHYANWSDRSRQTIAFGQEISVSAYQILQAASVIANDGILVPPRLVSKIVSADGRTVKEWKNGENRRVIKAETAKLMRSYMADTSSRGAMGWRASIQDISVGVKTGTSQIIDPATKKYSDTDFIASCLALLPAENPDLVLYLAIIKPKGVIYGARIAAPAIREAAEELIDYLDIVGRNPLVSHPPAVNIPTGRLPALQSSVPDFTGLSKRVLLPLLLRDDVTVEIRGDGWVRRQSPPAGTSVTAGMKIVLELE